MTGKASRRGAPERLQKVLARAGLGSRRSVETLIADGRVTVNGKIAELGEKVEVLRDAIKVDGRRIKLPERHVYLLLNKPDRVMTTRDDPEERRTVYDLLPKSLHKGLFPVGRLDYHTEGLLLLTTDGAFADRLTHPKHETAKVYLVKVRGVPTEAALDRLRRGIVLDGRRTKRCAIESRRVSGERQARTNSWWQVTLGEGRTRQIRRMFERIGHPVQRLKRTAVGSLRDGRLATGTYRELTEAEVDRLMSGKPLRLPTTPAKQSRAEKIVKKRAARKASRKKSAGRGSETRSDRGTKAGSGGRAGDRAGAKKSKTGGRPSGGKKSKSGGGSRRSAPGKGGGRKGPQSRRPDGRGGSPKGRKGPRR